MLCSILITNVERNWPWSSFSNITFFLNIFGFLESCVIAEISSRTLTARNGATMDLKSLHESCKNFATIKVQQASVKILTFCHRKNVTRLATMSGECFSTSHSQMKLNQERETRTSFIFGINSATTTKLRSIRRLLFLISRGNSVQKFIKQENFLLEKKFVKNYFPEKPNWNCLARSLDRSSLRNLLNHRSVHLVY